MYLCLREGFFIENVIFLCMHAWSLSRVQLFYDTLVDCQALLFMRFSRQESRVGCHFLLQGIFPTQGLNPHLLHWQVDSLPLSHQGSQLHLYLQPLPLGLHDRLSSASCQISSGIRLSWEHEPYSEMHMRGSRLCGEGNGNPLQYSCLENPVDRGAWRAAVHRVAQSWT